MMPAERPDVLLISDDRRLCTATRRAKPDTHTLTCLSSVELTSTQALKPGQVWIDLDCAPGTTCPGGSRRVYFYSAGHREHEVLQDGLFIRKPGNKAVFQILWAAVEPQPAASSRPIPASIPGWLLRFHELRLRSLSNTILEALPEKLGYRSATLYLYDDTREVLTLCQSNAPGAVDHVIPMHAGAEHPAARLIQPQLANPGPPRAPSTSTTTPADSVQWIPLFSDQSLVGSLRLDGPVPTSEALSSEMVEFVITFIGRAVAFAAEHERALTEARIDCLTGLGNKRWLIDALEREIRRTSRYRGRLSLLMIDLDGLKAVNDRHGHRAGDALLRHVANHIAGVLRQFDGAARIGGDEFLVMLPATNLNGARHVARRLLRSLRENVAQHGDAALPITASIGVAEWQPEWKADRLVEAADHAMYQAKRNGRNNIVCHATELAEGPAATEDGAAAAGTTPAASQHRERP